MKRDNISHLPFYLSMSSCAGNPVDENWMKKFRQLVSKEGIAERKASNVLLFFLESLFSYILLF